MKLIRIVQLLATRPYGFHDCLREEINHCVNAQRICDLFTLKEGSGLFRVIAWDAHGYWRSDYAVPRAAQNIDPGRVLIYI